MFKKEWSGGSHNRLFDDTCNDALDEEERAAPIYDSCSSCFHAILPVLSRIHLLRG